MLDQDVLSQALSLGEAVEAFRDGAGVLPDPGNRDRTARLAQILGGEDKRDFVLGRLGLTLREFDGLGDLRLRPGSVWKPRWYETAIRVVRAALIRRAPEVSAAGLRLGSPTEVFLAPFLAAADDSFRDLESGLGEDLSAEVRSSFRQCLVERLFKICGRTLSLEWRVYRDVRRGQVEAESPASEDLASEFASSLGEGGTLEILKRYPVLLRLCAVAIDRWLSTTRAFFGRLSRDRPAITDRFGAHAGRLVAIAHNRSDLHDGHQCVVRAGFESGLVLYYKPRPSACDAVFEGVLDWVNGSLPGSRLGSVEALDRGSYCWVREIVHSPCAGVDEGREYYRKMGMLLALLYLLRGNDFHNENLVASGSTPYLIDVETILQPSFSAVADGPPHVLATAQSASVLDVGLLPVLLTDPSGAAIDISGLRGATAEGRDADTAHVVPPYRPYSDGGPLDPLQHSEDLIAGFRDAYHLMMSSLLEPEGFQGLTGCLRKARLRVILRHTSSYAALIDLTLSPRYLRNGVDRSIELHVTGKPLAGGRDLAEHWPVIRSELRALEEIDIPLFTAGADSTDLSDATGIVMAGCFPVPPVDLVLAGLSRLTAGDCERQVDLIRSSLQLPAVRVESAAPPHRRRISNADKAAWAVCFGEMLLRDAIERPDGSLVWMRRSDDVDSTSSPWIDDGFYGGTLGLAYQFAALYRHTSRSRFRDAALRAAAPVLASIGETDPPPADRESRGLGLAAGLGAACYALARIAGFLDDRSILDHVLRMVEHYSLSPAAPGEVPDLMGGLAGAIVGLVVLHEATANPQPLELAERYAAQLLDIRPWRQGDHRTQSTDSPRLGIGFSHGASGVAYALGRLSVHRPHAVDRVGIRDMLESERVVLEANQARMPPSTAPGSRSLEVSWCRGAAGIALARLAIAESPGDGRMQEDLDAALQSTCSAPRSESFHLCCGNLGRLAVVFDASLRRSDPGRSDHVEGALQETLYQALVDAGVQCFPNFRRGSYDPGLFQGLAGLSYQFLRFAQPAIFPSLVGFE